MYKAVETMPFMLGQNLLSIVYLEFGLLLFLIFWIYRLQKKLSVKRKLEKKLKKLAFIDSLTGVFNRHALDVSLNREIAQSKRDKTPLSILFFDIDGFKQINDKYGHEVGDIILKEFSSFVQETIRKSDTFGRWGGDEFLLILPNTKKAQARVLSEKLDKTMTKHSFIKNISVSCCFGVASYIENDTKETMTQRGDKMLYNIKKMKEYM